MKYGLFRKLFQLELVKHRQSYFGFFLIVLVGALIPYLLSPFWTTIKAKEMILGIGMFAFVFGVPGTALVFSAVAASGLRKTEEKSKEDWIPVTPVQKVFAAWAFSFIMFLIVGSLLTVLSGYLLRSQQDLPLFVSNMRILYVCAFFLHMISFLFTYWTQQPLLGAGLASLSFGSGFLLSHEALRIIRLKTGYIFKWNPVLDASFFMTLLFAWAAFVITFLVLARNLEREKNLGWKRLPAALCLILLTLLIPPLLASNTVASRACMELNKFEPDPEYFGGSLNLIYDVLKRPGKGTILRTSSGGLAQFDEHGIARVIYEGISRRDVFHEFITNEQPQQPKLYGKSYWSSRSPIGGASLLSKQISSDGSLYAVLRDGLNFFLLYAAQGKEPVLTRLEVRQIIPSGIFRIQDEIVLTGSNGPYNFVESFPQPGQQPRWQFEKNQSVNLEDLCIDSLRHDGKLAEISLDGQKLVQALSEGKTKSWLLPGGFHGIPFHGKFVSAAFGSHELAGFIMRKSYSEQVILCTPDGSVRPLPIEGLRDLLLQSEGTVLIGRYEALAFSEEGHFYPKLSLKEFGEKSLKLLHFSEGQLWIQVGTERILQIDMAQSHVKQSLDLGIHAVVCDRTQEGMYFISDDRVCLMTWAGGRKDLGAAHL